jgi:hypothetical protein
MCAYTQGSSFRHALKHPQESFFKLQLPWKFVLVGRSLMQFLWNVTAASTCQTDLHFLLDLGCRNVWSIPSGRFATATMNTVSRVPVRAHQDLCNHHRS